MRMATFSYYKRLTANGIFLVAYLSKARNRIVLLPEK
jgi:hypothetical protein